jgi:transposase
VRYIGIDIASEKHVAAVVDDRGEVVVKAFAFGEHAEGYRMLFESIEPSADALVAMEATGHYWKNLFAELVAHGFSVALVNPLRTHRFAAEDLQRTKTDAVDALGIARFAAQKRPATTQLPDSATYELRELVRHRDRLLHELGDHVRQLHRLVDLGFPEFKRHVPLLDARIATAILNEYPTAAAFADVPWRRLANLKYGGGRMVGSELAKALIEAAKTSVGKHHGPAYRIQVQHACEDIERLRRRIQTMDSDIENKLAEHQVGTLLTTIDGIGAQTAAKLVAELGDPATFHSAAAIAAYVGVVPALRQSGKRQSNSAALSPLGHAALRASLWMPTLTAVQRNAWLKAHYERLRARGKRPKVAMIACMRKLLMAVYSVSKSRRPFVPRLAESHA